MLTTLISVIALVGVPYVLGVYFARANPGRENDDYTPRVITNLLHGS
jgi:hypothetical protein